MKIKIFGTGGQGIRLMASILGKILTANDYFVSLKLEYDTAVRGGNISADLIFSKKEIDNPIIDKADILVSFTDETADAEETVNGKGFIELSKKEFNSSLFANMIALGFLLKRFKLEADISEYLSNNFKKENLKAVNLGFSL